MANEAELTKSINNLTDTLNRMMKENSRTYGGKRPGGGAADETFSDFKDQMQDLTDEIKFYEKNLDKLNKAEKRKLHNLKQERIALANRKKIQDDLNSGDLERIRNAEREQKLAEDEAEIKRELNKETDRFKDKLTNFSLSDVKEAMMTGVEDYERALKLGTNLDYFDALKSGLSVGELNEIQSEFKATAIAMNQTGQGFNESIYESQLEMYGLTGSLAAAAKVTAATMDASRSLGLSFEDSKTMQVSLQDQFRVFHDNLGYTAEEFGALTESIIKDADSRKLMLRMSDEQRREYVNSRIEMVKFYEGMGLSGQKAIEMGERFDEMFGKKTAKDRMKDAVRMSVMGGMVGIDSQDSARARSIQMKAPGRQTAEEKKFLADYTNQISKGMEEFRGQGFTSELFVDSLNAKTDGLIDGISALNTDLNESNKKNVDIQNAHRNETLDNMLLHMRGIERLLESFPVMLAGSLVPLLFKAGAIKNMVNGMGKTAWSGGAGTSMLGRGAALLGSGAAVAGAGLAGWEIGSMIQRTLENDYPAAWDGVVKYLGGGIYETINFFTDTLPDIGSKAFDWVGNVKNEALLKVKSWGSQFLSFFDDMITGFGNYIKQTDLYRMLTDFGSYVSEQTTSLTDAAFGGISDTTSKLLAMIDGNDKEDVKEEKAAKQASDQRFKDQQLADQQKVLEQLTKQNELMAAQIKLQEEIRDSNAGIDEKTKKGWNSGAYTMPN
jgi:hypothetical protein